MVFEVHSTSGNFNTHPYVYYFKERLLYAYIRGKDGGMYDSPYVYENVSLNTVRRAMEANSFGREVF
jgi:hypothetical protein